MVKIGILGGIGPEASATFYTKLVAEIQKRHLVQSNKDFPQLIINSINAPELVGDRITSTDLAPYKQGIKELTMLEPDFILLVCNTIHLFLDYLRSDISIPFLDLRSIVKKYLLSNNISSYLVLGTPLTIRKGLYRYPALTIFKPIPQEQEMLSKAIVDFNRGFEKEKQVDIVTKICESYLSQGAETVLLGCTEFAVMLQHAPFPTINTIDLLVEEVVRIIKAQQQQKI